MRCAVLEGSDGCNFGTVSARRRLEVSGCITSQITDDAFIDIQIVIRLSGAGIHPGKRDLNCCALQLTPCSPREGLRLDQSCRGKVVPLHRGPVILAQPEWRWVCLKKWTRRVGDGLDAVVNVHSMEWRRSYIAIHAPKEQSTNAAKIRD